MATTTNYSWTTPDDTALVKDGASAIRTLGTSIDTTTKNLNPSTTLGDIEYRSSSANTNTRLGIGTSGQGLQVVSGVPSWAPSSTSTLTTTGDLLYASAANTLARIGIGTNGQVLTSNGSVPSWQTPATGSLTWTNRIAGDGTRFTQIAYNGTNLYVAVGYSGKLYSSTNGTTWTSRTSGFGANNIQDVAFGNGLWVAVGDNGTITTSTDGTTWTARTANMSTNAIYSVVYANSLWVAVGDGGGATNTGGITYSSDGLTWTRKSQTLTVGTIYYTVVWNGTNWIIGTNYSTNNYLYAATPSSTWTVGSTGSTTPIGVIYWDGTRHIFVDGNAVYYTTSTIFSSSPTAYVLVNAPNPSEATKGYFKFYNNILYRFSMALQSYTPVSSAYPNMSVPVLLPTATLSTTTNVIAGSLGAKFVGAVGYIDSDLYGRLYTSF